MVSLTTWRARMCAHSWPRTAASSSSLILLSIAVVTKILPPSDRMLNYVTEEMLKSFRMTIEERNCRPC